MELPKIVKIRQKFEGPKVECIETEVAKQFAKEEIRNLFSPGMKIAITGGSRGIANIAKVIRAIVSELTQLGVEPIIIPAMGSHGGATAKGQVEVLESLGVTKEYCQASICSSMEVVRIGETAVGLPVYMDKIAYGTDGVIVVNRIKAHTDFKEKIESGLLKMASIGLGKHKQAQAIHTYGVEGIRDHMPKVAEVVFNSGKVLMGVGLVENSHEQTAIIEAIPVNKIVDKEKELLIISKSLMPKLPIDKLDLLFVDQIGKNYSGTGMDTNIIGRIRIAGTMEPSNPNITYLIASDLSEPSHGNALGIGLADLTTQRLFEKINYQAMNENVITSTFLARASIPIVLSNDKEALNAAMRCVWGKDSQTIRFMRIPNTLHIEYMYASEALVEELKQNNDIEILSELEPLQFDENGYLKSF